MKKTILIIIALTSSVLVQAQENNTIYTDFNPDSCFTFHYSYDTLKFDLDQDGIADIVFKAVWHSAIGNIAVITTPSPNWQWSWSYASEFTPLTDTTLINGNLRWEYSGGQLGMYPDYTHFAFRHVTENGYCYGWAHIYVETAARVCMASMGYCNFADYPLRWGQTELMDIEETAESAPFATTYPNPTNGMVTITGENLRQAEVLNMLGQQVLSMQGEGEKLHLNMAALPVGVYFVTITDDEGRKCVRKVVKE